MSNLSELLPSGGGQNVVEFTADGAISSGQAVALQSNGTVKAISATGQPAELGTAAEFTSADVAKIVPVYDANANKIVIAYKDEAVTYGKAVVGTVSDVGISFGTPVTFETGNADGKAIVYDTAQQKVVILYQDRGNSGYGTAIVGTVSGTSISFGTAVVFESANSGHIGAAYDANAGKVVVSYIDYGNSSYGTSIVGTVSGTSISFGSPVVFESATVSYTNTVYVADEQKIYIAYRDGGNSGYGTGIVGTVSGTSISFGSATVLNTSSTNYLHSTYGGGSNVVTLYQDGGNSDYATAVVGTISGTSVSFGTEVVINTSGGAQGLGAAYNSDSGKVLLTYRIALTSKGLANVGTISGTSISFGSDIEFLNAYPDGGAEQGSNVTYDTTAKRFVIGFSANGTGSGKAIVYNSGGSNSGDFIGLASAAISDTATGDINVKGGINEAQTGLTIGSDYYVQSDGAVSTTSTSPAVKIGQAITATTINMMDLT